MSKIKMRVITKTGAQAGPGGDQLVQVTLGSADPKDPPCNVTITVPLEEEGSFPTWGVGIVDFGDFSVPKLAS